MNFINPPERAPAHVTHKTFYSKALKHEVGYNIYLPPNYGESDERFPVAYHLHGWTGNESSEVWPLEGIYKRKRAIMVFPNNSPVIEGFENLPVEEVLIRELMPLIDGEYRTDTARESRSLSGFSMGGGMAFMYAIKHPELFSRVTAYAGTYHHYFHKGSCTVGVAPERAAELYEEMIREKRDLENDNILYWVRRSADEIRGNLQIALHVGTEDILFCDNEILRLHLESLKIPHIYRTFEKAAHELDKIL